MVGYYEAVADLKDIYLEDSFVLGIHETENALLFDIDAVLTEEHPLYQPPTDDLRYCYKRARLSFSGHLDFVWIDRNLLARNIDLDGGIDVGQIDGFEVDGDGYYLDGEWGAVKISCDRVNLTFKQ